MTAPRIPRDTQFDFAVAMTVAVSALALAVLYAILWRCLG